MSGERVILVDGSWLIFRAYYAIPGNLMTSDGLHTNAIYGFATMFRKLLAGRTPEYGAVVFDPPGPTQRDEKFPDYKAQRPEMADELVEQLPWIDRVVEAHNFPMLRVPGYEADDVIGTLTRMALEAGHEVFIISGDKDFAQLVDGDVKMWDTMRDVVYDAELVRKKWHATPEKIAELLALMGDKSDNIPGVPGIGRKTAGKLLDEYGSIDGIYEHIDDVSGTKRRANLIEHKDRVELGLELTTIDCEVPLDVELDDIAVRVPELSDVNDLFRELQFYSLLARDEAHDEKLAEEAEFVVHRDTDSVRSRVAQLTEDDEPCLFLQFNDLDAAPRYGGLAGVAVVEAPHRGFYVPIDAADTSLGADGLKALRPWLEDPEKPKIAHDAKLAYRELRRRGVDLRGVSGDTMLASFLVDPTRNIPHDLPRVIKEYLHRVPPKARSVVGSGRSQKMFSDIAAEEAAGYACRLAHSIVEMWPIIRERLEDEGQVEQLYERDLPLSWVLARMELAGIEVDTEDLARMGEEFRAKLAAIESEIFEMAGTEFNLASPKQLGDVLFGEMGLPVIKRTKTGYSTAKDVLHRLVDQGHEIAARVLAWRKMAKLINTYTDVLQAAVDPEDGRIHATFQQTAGATGRLISTDPDLQRTPVRSPEGKRIRQTFVAADGHRLISADWSQIELRLLAHFSRDPRLVEAFVEGADVHARTASELFDVPIDEVTRKQRNTGKTVNFATIYGQGATALGQQLGIPRKEAKAYIERFFEIFADVRKWLDDTIASAHENGYVTTILGRRRYIPELSSNNFMRKQAGERIAANTPIQGSAADICKLVMLDIDAALRDASLETKMLLQIHDELVFEAPESDVDETVELIREAMRTPLELSVPLVVDVGVADNWDAAHA